LQRRDSLIADGVVSDKPANDGFEPADEDTPAAGAAPAEAAPAEPAK
jgi:hypothetical protein